MTEKLVKTLKTTLTSNNLVESCKTDKCKDILLKFKLCGSQFNADCVINILKNEKLTPTTRTKILNQLNQQLNKGIIINVTDDILENVVSLHELKGKRTKKGWRVKIKHFLEFNYDYITYNSQTLDIGIKYNNSEFIRSCKNVDADLNQIKKIIDLHNGLNYDNYGISDFLKNSTAIFDIELLKKSLLCGEKSERLFNYILSKNPALQPDVECLAIACKEGNDNIILQMLNNIIPNNECLCNICYDEDIFDEFYETFKQKGLVPNIDCLKIALQNCRRRWNDKSCILQLLNDGVVPDYECLLLACKIENAHKKNINNVIEKILEHVDADLICLKELCKQKGRKAIITKIIEKIEPDKECLLLAYSYGGGIN